MVSGGTSEPRCRYSIYDRVSVCSSAYNFDWILSLGLDEAVGLFHN